MEGKLITPWPQSGGKRVIADAIWKEFGNPYSFIDPFMGSNAVLFGRPENTDGTPRREIVGDYNGFVANAFRALMYAPEETAIETWWPTIHADITARHRYIVRWAKDGGLERLKDDPFYFDVRVAAWWMHGVSNWIGISGYAAAAFKEGDEDPIDVIPRSSEGGQGVQQYRVNTPGVEEKRPRVPESNSGVGVQLGRRTDPSDIRPHVDWGDKGNGTQLSRNSTPGEVFRVGRESIWSDADPRERWVPWFRMIARRMAKVQVISRSWEETLGSNTLLGDFSDRSVAIYLDPPYITRNRAKGLYAADNGDEIAPKVWQWALEHGDKPNYRIAYSCMEGDVDEIPDGWRVWYWTSAGWRKGEGSRRREMVICSPHCLGERFEAEQGKMEL